MKKDWQESTGKFKKGVPSWNKGIPASKSTKALWNINNGKTLCQKCHDVLRGRD